ncbi:uncharacterized protein LOC143907143 isoform X1 [Temnothorax americanus]|uniref:uncharacterized protein LOC143907143 isoform X1 n=2 Tax=Temnothorax americanus TaxID=1964332 RepID=UPI004068EF15
MRYNIDFLIEDFSSVSFSSDIHSKRSLYNKVLKDFVNIMAEKEEEKVTDILWEETKTFAVEQQQCLYDSLPDYLMYKSDEHKYLKQNIGYARYGSPKDTKEASATESNSCYCKTENSSDTDVADSVVYDKKAQETIDKIYDKICKCAGETDSSEPIYVGIIYNMVFRQKMNIKSKKKEGKKKEEKTEVKKEGEMEVKEMKTEAKEDDNDKKVMLLDVLPVPIFKIKRRIQKNSETTKNAKQKDAAITDEIQYETWFVAHNARVYKNWRDYIENNDLPAFTMVLPKDGVYQPNPDYPITEDYSTVWLEIMESPACNWKTKLCYGIDIASNVVGFGTVGLTVASLFTPLAPVVVVSGLAAAGATGAWSFGRNVQQLADRSSHEESIHVFDKEALPHYLGIAGTAFGLGVVGGSAIISNVAARGMTVNTVARAAFNTVQGGNLFINGVGVLYQSYNMIDKYITDKTVSVGDALNLATHLMFFCGSVVKVQFASDIIESTQGRIMNDYKESLGTKRLRKKYNRALRKAAETNVCKIEENAEVIRYIRNRQELSSNQSLTKGGNRISDKASRNIVWSCEHGRLKVNGILLLDPIVYVTRLIRRGIFIESNQNNSSGPHADDSIADQLARVLCDLLSKLYVSDDCPKSTKLPIVPDFEPLLREMGSMNINEECLKKLFAVAVKLMKRSKDMDDFLFLTFTFVWQYCKANLKQWGMSLTYCTQSISSSKILEKIIIAIFEAIDMLLDNLSNAFMTYMYTSLHR